MTKFDPMKDEKKLADAAHEAWAMLGTWITDARPSMAEVERVYGELSAALSDATGDTSYEGEG